MTLKDYVESIDKLRPKELFTAVETIHQAVIEKFRLIDRFAGLDTLAGAQQQTLTDQFRLGIPQIPLPLEESFALNFKSILENSPIYQIAKSIQPLHFNLPQWIYNEGFIEEHSECLEVDLSPVYQREEKDETLIIRETTRIKKLIEDIYQQHELIYKIEPRHFEELIAELFHKKGFEVELTKQTQDGGYDILAIKTFNGFMPIKALVECKRYGPNKKVGIDIIRSFCYVLNRENANTGFIFTTSYFTNFMAPEKELNGYRLLLKDRDDLFKWIEEYIKK